MIKMFRFELGNGQTRDVCEALAKWVLERGLGKLVGIVWLIPDKSIAEGA